MFSDAKRSCRVCRVCSAQGPSTDRDPRLPNIVRFLMGIYIDNSIPVPRVSHCACRSTVAPVAFYVIDYFAALLISYLFNLI